MGPSAPFNKNDVGLVVIVVLLVLFIVGCAWVSEARADCILTEQYQECNLPAAQRPFLTTIPLDCQIRSETDTFFVLRCRVNIGVAPKWVKGPRPVVKLPPLPRKRARWSRLWSW